MEGIKQNQHENDEVNEIKYKYQVEKQTNEELKERIMRLQNNMITSSVGHREQPSNKVKTTIFYSHCNSIYVLFYFRKGISEDELGVAEWTIHFLQIVYLRLLKKMLICLDLVYHQTLAIKIKVYLLFF